MEESIAHCFYPWPPPPPYTPHTRTCMHVHAHTHTHTHTHTHMYACACTHTHSTQGTEDIPLSDHNLVVMVTNTNYKHELVAGEYRERRESCESAAAKLGKTLLKEVTMEELEGVWYACSLSSLCVSGSLILGRLGTRLHALLELQFGLIPRLLAFSLGTRPRLHCVCVCALRVCVCMRTHARVHVSILLVGGVGLLQYLRITLCFKHWTVMAC